MPSWQFVKSTNSPRPNSLDAPAAAHPPFLCGGHPQAPSPPSLHGGRAESGGGADSPRPPPRLSSLSCAPVAPVASSNCRGTPRQAARRTVAARPRSGGAASFSGARRRIQKYKSPKPYLPGLLAPTPYLLRPRDGEAGAGVWRRRRLQGSIRPVLQQPHSLLLGLGEISLPSLSPASSPFLIACFYL